MMESVSYYKCCGEIEIYFDRIVIEVWKCLISIDKVSGIRVMVCVGCMEMCNEIFGCFLFLLFGWCIFDVGCGGGVLVYELVCCGVDVIGVDFFGQMIEYVCVGLLFVMGMGWLRFFFGDMFVLEIGIFDVVIVMDLFIYYGLVDMIWVVCGLVIWCWKKIVFILVLCM